MAIVSYIQECRAFCEFSSDERITANEVVLWHALFNLFNLRAASNVWPDGFVPLTNARVLSMTTWGSGDSAVETLRRARDRLITRGLIAYEPGERRQRAPMYRMRYFNAEAPVEECFTHKIKGNSLDKPLVKELDKPLDKVLVKVLDIKEKDIDPNPGPDSAFTHRQLSAGTNSARAGWFDPREPDQASDDGAWQQSARVRSAVAQRLISWALERMVPSGEDTHSLLCDLMAGGLSPQEITEAADHCQSMAKWEQKLLEIAHRREIDLGNLRGDLYELKRTRGLKTQDAVIHLREREKLHEEMAVRGWA